MGTPDAGAVIRRHAEGLMAVPGVVGVGEGTLDGRPCVVVFVTRRSDAVLAGIPQLLEGLPTRIVETGMPEAFERDR